MRRTLVSIALALCVAGPSAAEGGRWHHGGARRVHVTGSFGDSILPNPNNAIFSPSLQIGKQSGTFGSATIHGVVEFRRLVNDPTKSCPPGFGAPTRQLPFDAVTGTAIWFYSGRSNLVFDVSEFVFCVKTGGPLQQAITYKLNVVEGNGRFEGASGELTCEARNRPTSVFGVSGFGSYSCDGTLNLQGRYKDNGE